MLAANSFDQAHVPPSHSDSIERDTGKPGQHGLRHPRMSPVVMSGSKSRLDATRGRRRQSAPLAGRARLPQAAQRLRSCSKESNCSITTTLPPRRAQKLGPRLKQRDPRSVPDAAMRRHTRTGMNGSCTERNARFCGNT
jgi:hypothetical protein